VRPEDIRRLASYLGMDEVEFIRDYTDLHPDRRGLMLKNQPDGACVFLEGRNVCRVQEAKPEQCRTFPNGWNFPGWRNYCEAIPVSLHPEEQSL
jgi:Fe-S-cluster containining protein